MKSLATTPSRAFVSTRARTRSDREIIPTSDFPFATGMARKPVLIIFSAASGKTVSGVSSGGTWRTVETFVLGGRFLRRMSSRSVTTPTIFFRSRTGSSWTSWVFIFPRASPIVSSGATVTRSVVMKSDTRRSWTLFRFMVNPLGWEPAIAEVRIRKFFSGSSIPNEFGEIPFAKERFGILTGAFQRSGHPRIQHRARGCVESTALVEPDSTVGIGRGIALSIGAVLKGRGCEGPVSRTDLVDHKDQPAIPALDGELPRPTPRD